MAEHDDRAGARRFDPGGPVTGLFFLALAGLFLAEGVTADRLLNPVAVVPLVLIGLGLVGAVRVATRGRRRDRDRDLPRR
ncbi:hypothetical protein [Actinomadura sediminis]|uniref:DUF5668 domain-containing protein n=1 Tax=Actinomadura sediminis TaxID=1038904 RepID=A0ABW3ENR4_9ACTN